jgi:hypothetical protein
LRGLTLLRAPAGFREGSLNRFRWQATFFGWKKAAPERGGLGGIKEKYKTFFFFTSALFQKRLQRMAEQADEDDRDHSQSRGSFPFGD